jgi:hypothetical protein
MAVISMMRVSGDTQELAEMMRKMAPLARQVAPKHGGLGTIVARTDDGILVINLWKTEEGRHAMAEDPEVRQGIKDSGFPEPRFEGHEILFAELLPEAVEALSS